MAPTFSKVPPPPNIAQFDPTFNRWLHDLQAFINEGGGGINPGLIPGYDALLSTVATQTTEIASLTTQTATNTNDIAINTADIVTNTNDIATNTADIVTLTARAQVRNGVAAPGAGLGANGDWYADTVAKHIYVKVAGAWVLIV